MTFALRSFALAGVFVLAACGGGGGSAGGGSGGVGSGPQSVAITESNAKPVAANAVDSAQNTSATSGAALPIGVQVDAAAGATQLQQLAAIVKHAATSAAGARLPVGISISETLACSQGGTMTISGNVASPNGIGAGDTLSISASNCAESVGGQTEVVNGQLAVTIASGSITDALPFHVVMNVTVTNLSVQAGGVTTVANGDVRLDWTANSLTSETLSASGTAMSTRQTISGTTRTNTMRNYTQTLTVNGSTFTGTLSATIETDSTRLGNATVKYTITTPTPLVWSASTRLATAGVVKVVGANNSQLVATIAANGTVAIQVDANGDGTFETTVTSTTAELSGLR
ncbi:hypothetical protein [Ramlibacter sp. PS4R-6]|uniref:hypothetical protein n=1 Tax=Ramlibacter sp. PS4R-6 TaxID=3133438 RepID=UPI0030A9CD08